MDAGAASDRTEGTLNGGDGSMDILVVGGDASLADTTSGEAVRASNFEGLAVRPGTAATVSLTAAATGSILVAGSVTGDTLVGGAAKDTFVITKGVGAVTITGFGTTAGPTADVLVLKGFDASAKLTRGTTTSTQLLLDGNVIATVGDEAAAAITSAPSTFVVRQP